MLILVKILRVSHTRERAEKICLNCNTELEGRFCHKCGQENIEPRQSFWGLVSHFFEDITHFDGKFFATMGHLAKKPGFLPSEFIKGRRARYLNPIRMYVFTSAVFFFIFYSTVSEIREKDFEVIKSEVPGDSTKTGTTKISIFRNNYSSERQYDSIQQTLPPDQRTGWLGKMLVKRSIRTNEKYKGRSTDLLNHIIEGLVHSLPYLLFVSLPLYALYLKLLYRKRKYMYTDHAIFLIYLYIFTFPVLLVCFGLDALEGTPYIGWLHVLSIPIVIYGLVYTILALKRFYGDRFGKTLLKFIIFNIFAFFTMIILFLIFFLLTLFRV